MPEFSGWHEMKAKMHKKVKISTPRLFTLVELLVVAALLSLISVVVVPMYEHRAALARDEKCRSNQFSLYQALSLYNTDNGRFPAAARGEWIDYLAGYLNTDREGVKRAYFCPEREKLGILRMKSDYGLNFLVGWVPDDVLLPPGADRNVFAREFLKPQKTYFLSCTADFSYLSLPQGVTGTGHMDPIFQHPDRRHGERSMYIMTYADGHSENMGFYQRSLKFPEWIGNSMRAKMFSIAPRKPESGKDEGSDE